MAAAPDHSLRRSGLVGRIVARWAAAVLAVLVGWLLALAGQPTVGTALAGGAVLWLAFWLGLGGVRRLLSGTSAIASVAKAVVDEAIRMRSTLVLLVLLLGTVPVLPLLVDPAERLTYRVQFLIGWTLGGASLLLGLLTIFLACGTVCGDIDSGRIHMTIAKPVRRWEYLVGKWLGIAVYDLLLVLLAGVGSYALVQLLALRETTDPGDREALAGQVLVARRCLQPGPDRPDVYAAAIDKAIARLEADSPDGLGPDAAAVRRRIRQEYDRQWHTVTPDMETTFVFSGLGSVAAGSDSVQLQVEPRVTNVDVDLADVRFAVWLNGRPWPMADGVQQAITLPSRARHVFDLPLNLVTDGDELRIRIANRNLVPPGETRPTAITFPPGDGMQLFARVGTFEGNLIRCLLLMWAKLVLVAAAGVAAGAMFDLPAAILATLVFFFAAVGNEFFAAAGGVYNVVAETGWERAATRGLLALESLQERRWYDALRMLLGFVSDGLLWILPSFSADAAISRLATGIAIPLRDVVTRLALFGVIYPLAVGSLGWLVFERRDLVRSSS